MRQLFSDFPFGDFFTEEGIRRFQMRNNRPSLEVLKKTVKQYCETTDKKYSDEAVIILLRFRIVMTDYLFEKLLKELRLTKESVVAAMASALNFTPAEKGEAKWLKIKV